MEGESFGVWCRFLSSSLSFPTSLWDCCVLLPVALPYSLLFWKIDRLVTTQRLVGRLCSGLFCFDRVCFSCVCVCVSKRELTIYIVIISNLSRIISFFACPEGLLRWQQKVPDLALDPDAPDCILLLGSFVFF